MQNQKSRDDCNRWYHRSKGGRTLTKLCILLRVSSLPRQNAVVLVFWAVAGAVLYHFGCRLLDAYGYSRAPCIVLLGMIVLVFVFLGAGSRRSVR